MTLSRRISAMAIGLMSIFGTAAHAEDLYIEETVSANSSTGKFAPYYIGSLNGGRTVQRNGLYGDLLVRHSIDERQRFSVGYGGELMLNLSTRNHYAYWKPSDTPGSATDKNGSWAMHRVGQNPVYLQQLYAELKYRSIYMMAGAKYIPSPIVNNELSSGDLIVSNNARPVPQLSAGFYDFQNVPFTQGWIQINGAVGYGMLMDDGFMKDFFNRYNYHLAENTLYNYKYCYFRSNPNQPFMVTAGMQSAGMFGGKAYYYSDGRLIGENKYKVNLDSFFNMLLPVFNSGEKFAEGSTIGSWDFRARYRLRDLSEISAYFQWIFEDGSGIARRNKLDGLWGVEYKGKKGAILSGIVVEYLDLRDQSGPIHYAPGDYPGSTIHTEATGRDNYYNNGFYNAYSNYGMAMGTPMILSPIYNLDGYPAIKCNRVNGIHIGAMGNVTERVSYRLMAGYQRGLGTYETPYMSVRTDTSVMLEGVYNFKSNMEISAKLAYDHGNLRGNNFGALVSLRIYQIK